MVDSCVSFLPSSPCHWTSVFWPAGGSQGGPTLGLKLLRDAPGVNRIPSTVRHRRLTVANRGGVLHVLAEHFT